MAADAGSVPHPAPRGRLAGRVAIITGAARGQGAAEAALFCREGASVLVADVLDDQASKVAAAIGDAALAVHLDVSSPEDWRAAVVRCIDRFGPPTVLVNNAGLMRVAPFADTDEAAMRAAWEVNVMGAFHGIQAVRQAMTGAGGGSIVNVSSINGMKAGRGLTAYTTTKFALRGLTRSAALELGAADIRVNSLHPGPIDTPMIRDPALLALRKGASGPSALADRPIPRFGEVEEMAAAALFLASDESSFCTGTELLADGGALV